MKNTWDPTVPAILLAAVIVAGSVAATGGLAPGEWKGKLQSDRATIQLTLRARTTRGDTRTSFPIGSDELGGFDVEAFERAGAPLHLTWHRSAGDFVFEGEGGWRPRGSYRFEPAPGFVEGWRELGFAAPGANDLFFLALNNVGLADAQRLRQLGYTNFDADDLVRLSSERGMMDWIEGMQGLTPQPSLNDLFRLRSHGVEPETVRSFTTSGLAAIGVEPLLQLIDHGVEASYVRGLVDAGVDAADLDGILRLHAHGVTPEYVAELFAAGLPDLGKSVNETIRIHDHGVEPSYVRGMVETGLPGLSVEGVLQLSSHGVDVGFTRTIVASGPGKEGADAVILLQSHGTSEEWMREMAELGYGDLPPEALVRLVSHGVSTELVRTLAHAGHHGLTADDLIRAATHGPESLGLPRDASNGRPTS